RPLMLLGVLQILWIFGHLSPLPKRRLDNLGGNRPAADLDGERRPFRRKLGRNVADSDRLFHGGTKRPGGHYPCRGAVLDDVVAVARYARLQKLEANELSAHPFRLLALERRAADEVPLVQLHNPAQPGLERCVLFVDVVAVERELHLGAQGVSSSESCRNQALLPFFVQQGEPKSLGLARSTVELESVLAGVARAGEDARHPCDVCFGEAIASQGRQSRRRLSLEDCGSLGSLQSELGVIVAAIDRLDPARPLGHPAKILFAITRVDTDQNPLRRETIGHHIIDETSALVEQTGVDRLAVGT